MSSYRRLSDEKFVRDPEQVKRHERVQPLQTYKFRRHRYLEGKQEFPRKDVSIIFKTTAERLEELCLQQIDKFELVSVYEWSTDEVCKWLRDFGFRQYTNTFRKNKIEGQKLLLLDASALCAMNIQDFDHIQQIAQGIRKLFFYELTNFARSISLSREYYMELFKLYRVQTGPRYELTRRSDLLRRMQLVRERPRNLSHWQRLEKWLQIPQERPPYKELIGQGLRKDLYKCHRPHMPVPQLFEKLVDCNCMPPCTCCWNECQCRPPWRLRVLPVSPKKKPLDVRPCCNKCMPPCICKWSYRDYNDKQTLSILGDEDPDKYATSRAARPNMKFQRSLVNLARTQSIALLHHTTPSKIRMSRALQRRRTTATSEAYSNFSLQHL